MEQTTFSNNLKNNPRPVVVDVWAPWCMPCRSIRPALRHLEETYHNRVDVWEINADEQPELVRQLGIQSIPTLLVYQGEHEIVRQTGAQPQSVLQGLFEAALNGQAPARSAVTPTDRLVRLTLGFGLAALGLVAQPAWLLLALGGLVAFTAVYDRCPIWQAVTRKVKSLRNDNE